MDPAARCRAAAKHATCSGACESFSAQDEAIIDSQLNQQHGAALVRALIRSGDLVPVNPFVFKLGVQGPGGPRVGSQVSNIDGGVLPAGALAPESLPMQKQSIWTS